MKNKDFKKILIILSLIAFSGIVIMIVLNESICLKSLGFGKDTNLSTNFNNYFAPIIGIVSIILLYITLNKQIDANENAKNRNEIDILLILINDFKKEFEYINYKGSLAPIGKEYFGSDAINYLGKELNENKLTYSEGYYINKLKLINLTFKVPHEYFKNSTLDDKSKKTFHKYMGFIFDAYCVSYYNDVINFHKTYAIQKSDFKEELEILENDYHEIYNYYNR